MLDIMLLEGEKNQELNLEPITSYILFGMHPQNMTKAVRTKKTYKIWHILFGMHPQIIVGCIIAITKI